jgi:hypothetical protein
MDAHQCERQPVVLLQMHGADGCTLHRWQLVS